MSYPKPYLVIIAGPTAVGKTATGIALAQHFKSVILSADSRQFYKETNIGTAKPSAEEMAEVTHYFVNTLSINEDYNAGDFERDATKLAAELFVQYNPIFVVGGSGLYLKALAEGLDNFPNPNPIIRQEIMAEYAQTGITFLQNRLQHLDPLCYQNIDRHNPQRMIRALEVCLSTGKPYSSFLTKPAVKRPFEMIKIGIAVDKNELHERIDKRIDNMIEQGLVEEARRLYPYRTYNALQTVGYKELFACFDGQCTLEQAIAQIKMNTRHYAKRQMTWFKKYGDWRWFRPDKIADMVDFIAQEMTK